MLACTAARMYKGVCSALAFLKSLHSLSIYMQAESLHEDISPAACVETESARNRFYS